MMFSIFLYKKLLDTYFKIFIVDLKVKIDYTLTNKRLVSWIEILKAETEEELNKLKKELKEK